MREVITKTTVYTFEEADRVLKDKIIENFALDGYLYEFCMQERIEVLKEVARLLGGALDYSLSCVPSRGEFISIKPKYDFLDFDALWEVIDVEKECPITGVCYDHDLIDHLSKYNKTKEGLQYALDLYIDSIHDEYLYMLSDDYIADLCEANGYEFTEDGKLY